MISSNPSGEGSILPDPWGVGSVSLNPLGVGSASPDPLRGDSASPDPWKCIRPRARAQAPVGACTASNYYGCDDTGPQPCS
jgi:hypothetical protein